jgi:hypothetical protein
MLGKRLSADPLEEGEMKIHKKGKETGYTISDSEIMVRIMLNNKAITFVCRQR